MGLGTPGQTIRWWLELLLSETSSQEHSALRHPSFSAVSPGTLGELLPWLLFGKWCMWYGRMRAPSASQVLLRWGVLWSLCPSRVLVVSGLIGGSHVRLVLTPSTRGGVWSPPYR